MGASNRQPRRLLALDAGLSTGLLLALVAVVIVDLSLSNTIPSAIDLVFILDDGRAMTGAVDSMKANCLEQAKDLQARGIDCRYAVIPFGCADVPGVSRIPFTQDLGDFTRQISTLSVNPDGHPVHSLADAIDNALELSFLEDASVFFFVVTNTPVQENNRLVELANQMASQDIHGVIQANASEQDALRCLYQNGGRFFTLQGEDLTEPSAEGGQTASNSPASLFSPMTSGSVSGDSSVVAKGLYGLRTDQHRDKWIGDAGGSKESERAVKDGLDWLARHQADEGYWADSGKCELDRCPSFNYGATNAETGLAILAFQAGGHYSFNKREHSQRVQRGLDWLVKQQGSDGRLFGPVATWYEHGIATFALAEACAVSIAECRTPDADVLNAAQRAVAFIEEHQYQGGGWQYALDSSAGGDTSVTGWQALALKSALEAKIELAPETMQRVTRFYESCGDPSTGQTGYMNRGVGTDLTTAVGLIVQEFIAHTPDSPLAQKAAEHLEGRANAGIGTSVDFYTLYNATLAMYLAGGEPWENWNNQVRDQVIQRQEKSGCARGSWNSTYYQNYNRTLSTAWAVLTLEVYYRYAPSGKDGGN